MNQTREVLSQNSCYTYVMEDEETARAGVNVFELSERGELAALERLVQRSPALLEERDEGGAGPLHHAAGGGHVSLIQFITSLLPPEELNGRDGQGGTPLHWAVERDQAASCRALMDLRAEPNILNNALMSPLHLAISHNHTPLVELLVSYINTDCNLKGDLGNTPLMLACSINNWEALSILLQSGGRLCSQNKLGHFAIHAAAFAGATRSMEVILTAGEKLGHPLETHINYLDKSKSSPLHLAVRGGSMEAIRLCLHTGARVDQQQLDLSTPLHLASTQGAVEAVKMMLSSYCDVENIINLTDGACQTPLHRASIFDHAELVDYLISMGGDVERMDCNGNSPLLLATSCGSWRTVALLLAKGANMAVRDRSGCNFLHLAILQRKGLKNLSEDVMQSKGVKALLSSEDHDGCTPLHYACRLGVHNAVKNMLGLSGELCLALKSKDKKSALHFAAQYGRINTCHRLLETITDSRLVNEGDEAGLTPLHLASKEGHTQVVELLLRKGALFHSDYRGWTCVHHAASEGYTQTLRILLSASTKLLDKTDEDGNTALHIGAREGHVSAVLLLLSRGAEIVLSRNQTSFLHEALLNCRQDVVNAVIDSDRCTEALRLFSPASSQQCPVLDMIEILPESYKYLLDRCVRESDDDPNSPEFTIEYNFQWLQAPISLKKMAKITGQPVARIQPLIALNTMVKYNRIELLSHPVCQKYLEMKWVAYGSLAHVLNMVLYLMGQLPLTYLTLALRPSVNTTLPGQLDVEMVPVSFSEQSFFLSLCMVMVVVMNFYAIGKEVLQIFQQRWNYFKDSSNHIDWLVAFFSLAFVIPLALNAEGSLHWQAGAVAVFHSWVCFLLYLQRFDRFGIYVVMFGEIMKTLVSIVMLFLFLMVAFGLGFHALMLNQKEFATVPLSVIQIFVMMIGELNYETNFLKPNLDNKLPFTFLTYVLFIEFALLMPILLVNLLIGLAVGDIAEVQKNASLKRMAMQIELHTVLEDKLPYWFMKRVDKPFILNYPNRKCSKSYINMLLQREGEERTDIRPQMPSKSSRANPIENELQKQKTRMKEMSCLLEKQHGLLKLVLQKMEITSEADEYDGPEHFRGRGGPRMTPGPRPQGGSKWIPLMKALDRKSLGK
ncbi:transient receptor potential cation channel subfamily A member 1b [Gadus chalcogrammus]|uniref:transient receptor potential cation channel subfamily A member 1b n=1 Tax=Gadus chalcogrammus TaxID=1042646 RepID=UPI0024C48D14|nr:transient receptor potential cation channel subfamily A member 1b [Gadus chalcogrammus]